MIFFTGFEVISFSCEMYPSNFVLWPSRTLTRSSRPEDIGACGRGLLPVATKGAVPLPTLRGVVIGVAKSEDKLSRCLLRVSRVLETFLEERERERERERRGRRDSCKYQPRKTSSVPQKNLYCIDLDLITQ